MKRFGSVWLAIIIDSMGFGLVYPIMTLIFLSTDHPILPENASEQLRYFLLSLSYLLYPLTMFFGASYLSDLSDHLGRKKVLVISLIGVFASLLAMGIGTEISSIFLLLFGRGLMGLFAGAQATAQAAIADVSTPDRKKHNMSLMTLAISFGIILGPIVGGFFADAKLSPYFTFATPFYVTSLLVLFDLIWLITGFKETHPPDKEGWKIDFLRPITAYFDIFFRKRIRFLVVIFLFMQIGFGTFFRIIQVRLVSQFGYSALDLGLFNTGIGLSFAVAIFLSLNFLLKRFSAKRIGSLSLLLTGLFLIATSIASSHLFVIGFSFFSAGFDMIAYSMMITAFSHAVGREIQGWVMGIFAASMALAWVVSGFTPNLLSILGVEKVLGLGAIAMIVSGILMILYNKRYPQPILNE